LLARSGSREEFWPLLIGASCNVERAMQHAVPKAVRAEADAVVDFCRQRCC
jgi:hypothetical protein